jgi:hypothetical protein
MNLSQNRQDAVYTIGLGDNGRTIHRQLDLTAITANTKQQDIEIDCTIHSQPQLSTFHIL